MLSTSPVVNKAQEWARARGHTPDALHVVYTALYASLYDQPLALGSASEALRSVDPSQRYAWMALVLYELAQHPLPAAWTEERSPRLQQYEMSWQKTALQYNLTPTNALTLGTILREDASQLTMMSICGINSATLVQALFSRINQPDPQFNGPAMRGGQGPWGRPDVETLPPPPGAQAIGGWPPPPPPGQYNGHQPTPSWPPAPAAPSVPLIIDVTQREDVQSLSEASRLVRPLAASEGQLYQELHANDVNRVLAKLVESIQSRAIPVLAGHYGSPIDKIGLAVASSLGQPRPAGAYPMLAGYRVVHSVYVPQLVRRAEIGDAGTLSQLLGGLKRRAQLDSAILLLDHVEQVRDQDAASTIQEQLGDHSDVPVLGVYHAADSIGYTVDQIRQVIPSADVVPIHEYAPNQTLELLKFLSGGYWQRQGFHFDPKAFERVLMLHDGAWENLHRKWLPYLAVDLGEELIATIQQHGPESGTLYIKQAVQGARGALEQLGGNGEWESITRQDIRDTLNGAKDDLAHLARTPTITRDKQGLLAITRPLVTAFFLNPSSGREYHVQGHKPLGVS